VLDRLRGRLLTDRARGEVDRPVAAAPAVVRSQHEKRLADGRGAVTLPDALERKYPRAPWDLGWQWVFPAAREYVARTGTLRRHHLHPTVVPRAFRASVGAAGTTKPAAKPLRHNA